MACAMAVRWRVRRAACGAISRTLYGLNELPWPDETHDAACGQAVHLRRGIGAKYSILTQPRHKHFITIKCNYDTTHEWRARRVQSEVLLWFLL